MTSAPGRVSLITGAAVDGVAETTLWAATRPAHLDVGEVLVRPIGQPL
ncbi:MAG: hypothetical protein V7607_2957 [Solirubrobacteraceae bacterium]